MRRQCAVDGCERVVQGHGWCLLHYKRWRRRGSVVLPPRPTAMERFMKNIEYAPDGCWLWTGAKTRGYGHFSADGWQGGAYRWLYQQVNGPLRSDQHLDHLCRRPACVNPAHLEPVTCRQNLLRGATFQAANAAKTHCIHGHEFTPENTYLHMDKRRGGQRRICRTCARLTNRRFLERRKSA